MRRILAAPVTLVLAGSLSLSVSACKRGDYDDYSDQPASAQAQPTPRAVCESMANIVAAEMGGQVDPALRTKALQDCVLQMHEEQRVRSPEDWDGIARCVIAARSNADIERCDQLYPIAPAQPAQPSWSAQPSQPAQPAGYGQREQDVCVWMLSLLLQEAQAKGQDISKLTDADYQTLALGCLDDFAAKQQTMTPQAYSSMLDCMIAAPDITQMERC